MKNKFFIILYSFFFFVTLFIAYDFFSSDKNTFVGKTVLSLDTRLFESYHQQFDINRSFGYIWGFKDPVIQKIEQIDTNKTKLVQMLPVIQKKSLLCIEKDCFRFLGLFTKEGQPYISFYNKNFKHKIADFALQQNLAYTLYIKDITHNSIVIADRNSSREWNFQLFDVNVTKYKPKDINETEL